jgi:hypothetical protein
MEQRLSRPNSGPQPRTIQVDGVGEVQVSPNFFELSPQQQQQVVSEIVADYGGQRQQATAQPQQAPQPQEREMVTPDWLNRYAPTTAAAIDETLHHARGAVQGLGEAWDRSADLLEGAYNNTIGALIGDESHSADPILTTADLIAGRGPMGAAERLGGQLGQGSEGGHLAGEILGSAILTRGVGGPVAQGAATGALMSDADNTFDFGRDIVEGGAGGFIGDRLVRGAQFALNPVIERGARLLREGGVRLTPGQALPVLREFEDKSMTLPFAGPQIAHRRGESFEDFARAVPRDALETLRTRTGRAIPEFADNVTGQEAIRHTGDEISRVYEDVIPRLRLSVDPQLQTDMAGVSARIASEPLTAAGQRRFQRIVENSIVSRFRGASATGREYQAVDTDLERQIARFGRSTDPDDQIIAEGLQDIRATLRNGVVRQNGRLGQELEAADEAWSMLVPAEAAAANARRGFFSPAQYRAELRRGDNRVRRRGMARGEVRGQEFAEAGGDILPSEFPNPSGTAGHEAYSVGNTRFYQGLVTRGLYGPLTQNALLRATVDRPPFLEPLGRTASELLGLAPAPQAGAALLGGSTNALFGY